MKKHKVKKVEREHCEQPFGYKVNIESYCEHSERENVEFGSWEESWTNLMGEMIVREDKYPDVATIYDLKPGDRAFVVWVEWSSGDSFGHGDRKYTQALGLFKTYEDAEVLQKAIEEHAHGYDRRGNENDRAAYWVKTPDGQIFQSGWAAWLGYFESLDSVRIDRVEVR